MYLGLLFLLIQVLISHGQPPLFEETITDITVALNYELSPLPELYLVYLDGTLLDTTDKTFYEYQIDPNSNPNNVKICSNEISSLCTDPISITYTGTLSRDIIPLDSTKSVFYFESISTEAGLLALETIQYNSGTSRYLWTPLEFSFLVEPKYTFNVETNSGKSELYRIKKNYLSSAAFWYSPKPQIYPPNSKSVTSLQFPSLGFFSVGEINVTKTTPLILSFAVQNQIPNTCNIVSARLKLKLSASSNYTSNPNGIVRVFTSAESNPLLYMSNENVLFSSIDNEKTLEIPLDRSLPYDIYSFLNECNMLSSCFIRIEIIDVFDTDSLVFDNYEDIILEVAFEAQLPTLNSITYSVISSTISEADFSPSIFADEVYFYWYYSQSIDLSSILPLNSFVASVKASITGSWRSGIISSGLSNVKIGSKPVDQIPVANLDELILESEYTSFESFSVNDTSILEFYLLFEFTTDDMPRYVDIETIELEFRYFYEDDFIVCNEIFISPSPTPTPSVTPTSTKSLSNTPTNSKSETPTISPSQTRSMSLTPIPNISSNPTPTLTATNSNSQTPTPTIAVNPFITQSPLQSQDIAGPLINNSLPLSKSSSPTRSSSFTQIVENQIQTPEFEPVKVEIDTNPIQIYDSEGNLILDIRFDYNNPNEFLIISPIEDNPPIFGSNSISSLIYSITLIDEFGFEIQPSDSVEICMKSNVDEDKSCLGFINDDSSPPKWECEDNCLNKKQDLLCGKTDHFTNFAVLFTGSNNNCNAEFDLIFDKSWKDGVLIGCVAGAILLTLLCITIFIACTPVGSRFIRGKEGNRIYFLRKESNGMTVSKF